MPEQNDSIQQNTAGETPFKPEYEDFIADFPGRGSLKVQASIANEAFPLKDVYVDVALVYKGKRYTIYHDVTDSSGIVNQIVLPSRLGSESLSPESAGEGDVQYLVSAFHPGFEPIVDCPVLIQDRVETILPLSLNPNNLT